MKSMLNIVHRLMRILKSSLDSTAYYFLIVMVKVKSCYALASKSLNNQMVMRLIIDVEFNNFVVKVRRQQPSTLRVRVIVYYI